MTLQPIMPAVVLALIAAALLAFVVVRAVRSRGKGERTSWLVRGVLVLAVIGMALRPGIPGAEITVASVDLDVVFVVDTTASSAAEDWNGTQPRLDGMRADIEALLQDHPGARFAVITFDSSAVLRVPFTSDTTAVSTAVTGITPEIGLYSAGTTVSEPVELLTSTLQRSADAHPERARVVYYLGDGEQTSSADPGSFATAGALTNGGAVLGYGTAAGGKMLEQTGYYDSSSEPVYITDRNTGEPAVSTIDENNLRTIADQLGVEFQLRSVDTAVTPAAVDTQVSSSASGDTVGSRFELYWILALLAFALLCWEATTIARRFRDISDAGRRTGP